MTWMTDDDPLRKDGRPLRRRVWVDRDSRPHWRTHGTGTAKLDVQVHERAGWVNLLGEEWSNEANVRTKRVILTLDAKTALALRDFLSESLARVEVEP